MARYYDRRDLIGHWVERAEPEQHMCEHACCRGYRVHPANMPVVLPRKLLRRASEKDLLRHYDRLSDKTGPRADRARLQVLYEIDRREQAEKAQARRQTERAGQREARAARRAAEVMEREAIMESAWLQAEEATKGNMLNKRGRAAGISDRSLFRGPEARARKYASEELLEHWQTHPRPTGAMFAGKNTRVYEQYAAPGRTRRGRPIEDFWINRRIGGRRRAA